MKQEECKNLRVVLIERIKKTTVTPSSPSYNFTYTTVTKYIKVLKIKNNRVVSEKPVFSHRTRLKNTIHTQRAHIVIVPKKL